MAITFNGGTFASYTDTTANDTAFPNSEGQIDNTAGAGTNGVGDLFDTTPSTYTYALTGAGVQTIAGGTLISNAYGQLIIASNGRYQFVPNAAGINSLPAGQQVLNFTVQVTDATGETASSIFTIQLAGATDAPTLTGGALATFVDTAANDVFAVQSGRIDNDPTATTTGAGQLRGDTGSTYTYALTGAGVSNSVVGGQNVGTELVGTYGRLVLATDGRYQYVPNDAAINAVPAGSNPVDTFTVRINDSNGTSATSTFTVQVNGATETAVSLTGGTLTTYTDTAATGETFAVQTGTLDTDPLGASNGTGNLNGGTGTVRYALTGTGVTNVTVGDTVVGTQLTNEFGRLTIAADGRYQFEPNSTAIDTLPAGLRTLNYTVQVTDTNGSTASATYTINLNGATDTQTLAGGQLAAYTDTAAFDTFAVRQGTIDTNPTATTNGVGQLTGDTGTRTYSLTNSQATNIVVNGVVVGQELNTFYGRLVLSTDGRYQFVPNDTTLNSLSTGDNGNFGFGINVATTNGTVTTNSTGTFTLSVTGTTDTAPVLTSGTLATYVDNEATDTFAVQQGSFDTNTGSPSNGTTNGFLDGGTGAVAYSIVGANVTTVTSGTTVVGYQSVGTYGRLTVSTDGRYQFEPNNATIDALPLGTNPVNTFAIRVTDAAGASSTANYTVNITGGTDAPTVNQTPTAPYFTQVAETDAAIAVSGRVEGADRAGNTLTYSYNPTNSLLSPTTNSFSSVNATNGQTVTLTAAQQTAIAQGFAINAQTGAYTFNLASPDFLDPGQTLVAGFRVNVTNQFGETTSQNVQVNITGTIEQGPAGTAGNDTLTGGNFGDLILGRGGDDTINGGGGNDSILGGSGDDLLRGGLGFNTIEGGDGDDIGLLEYNRNTYQLQVENGSGNLILSHRDTNGVIDERHVFNSVENFVFANGEIVTQQDLYNQFYGSNNAAVVDPAQQVHVIA